MKKKILCVLFLSIFMFSLTGCVKFNANMDIKKDKSMDFSIIYAFDTSIFGDESIVNDAEKSNLEKEGFTVSDYSDGNMKGVTLSKKIKNIDSVSNGSDVSYDLSGIVENSSEYIFNVKKGFLKNTYTAKFNFDASDSDFNLTGNSDDEINSNEDILLNDAEININKDQIIDDNISDDQDIEDLDISADDEVTLDGMDDFNFSSMSNMDLSFNVTLPYSAISNNATSVSDNSKQLSWSLTSNQASTVEFEFELYNFVNIAIAGGCALLLIIIMIVVISKGKKNKKKTVEVNSSDVVPELTQIDNGVRPFSEQSFNEQLKTQNQGIDTVVDVQPVQPEVIQPAQNVQSEFIQPQVGNGTVQPVQPEVIQPVQNVQPEVVQSQSNLSTPDVNNIFDQPVIDNSNDLNNGQNN